MVKALAPAIFRVGGGDMDYTEMHFGDVPDDVDTEQGDSDASPLCPPAPSGYVQPCGEQCKSQCHMNSTTWGPFLAFAERVGVHVVAGLNALDGRMGNGSRPWDPTRATEFVRWVNAHHPGRIVAYELGNGVLPAAVCRTPCPTDEANGAGRAARFQRPSARRVPCVLPAPFCRTPCRLTKRMVLAGQTDRRQAGGTRSRPDNNRPRDPPRRQRSSGGLGARCFLAVAHLVLSELPRRSPRQQVAAPAGPTGGDLSPVRPLFFCVVSAFRSSDLNLVHHNRYYNEEVRGKPTVAMFTQVVRTLPFYSAVSSLGVHVSI